MTSVFKGAVGFVVGYLILMVPTYLLPYLGSNSVIVGALASMAGRSFTPQFWLHLWCLMMLVLVTSIRARNIGKSWLMIFPVTAGIFDLTPGLSLVPFVPTVMHLVVLVLGAKGSAAVLVTSEDGQKHDAKTFNWEPWAAGLLSLSVISGIFNSLYGVKAARQQTQAVTTLLPVKPKAEDVKAPSAGTASVKINSSAAQTGTSGQVSQAEPAATVSQNLKSSTSKPRLKKARDPTQASQSQKPKKVDGKATVKLIDINN